MKLEYDKLFDKYSEIESNNKEMNLRFSGMEKSSFYMEKEKESTHLKI